MATRTHKWEGAGTKLPSGHRIFETKDIIERDQEPPLRWAITDHQSSRLPQNADGGVLWLDESRCLNASTRHSPLIPVVDNDGKVSESVRVDAPTILFLSRLLGWTIVDEVRGHYYNVH